MRKRNGTGRHIITGKGKGREVVAYIVGILLCYGSKGRDSITASERDYREANRHCQ
jgi:hypothetical protein